jgi:hypothetical protein
MLSHWIRDREPDATVALFRSDHFLESRRCSMPPLASPPHVAYAV